MTRDQIQELCLTIIKEVDYDIWKSFQPELAEEPEEIQESLDRIVDVAENFIKQIKKS